MRMEGNEAKDIYEARLEYEDAALCLFSFLLCAKSNEMILL